MTNSCAAVNIMFHVLAQIMPNSQYLPKSCPLCNVCIGGAQLHMIWIPFSKSLRLRSYEAAILTALNSNVWGGEGCRQRASKCSYLCSFLHLTVVPVSVLVVGTRARARLCVGPASISAVTRNMTAANSSTLMQCTGPLGVSFTLLFP